jgi:hypothetical protein
VLTLLPSPSQGRETEGLRIFIAAEAARTRISTGLAEWFEAIDLGGAVAVHGVPEGGGSRV